MTFHNMQYGERFISATTSLLKQKGITVIVGHDFDVYRDLLAQARPDHTIGAPFDPSLHRLHKNNALWMMARDANGVLMHTQALRMLDGHYPTVADYFLNKFRDFPPSGVPIDLARSRYRAGPGAKRMQGRTAYHGEFWMGGAPGEYRGSGLSSIFSRLGFWEAMQLWDPDHIVAFMAQAVAFKGLVERTGWMHTDPGALQWYLDGNDKPIEGFLAYLHREDLHYLLDIPLLPAIPQAA